MEHPKVAPVNDPTHPDFKYVSKSEVTAVQKKTCKYDEYLRYSKDDPLLTSWYRYFAYVNDFGEAFKQYLFKPIYYGSYAVTGIYAISSVWNTRRRMQDTVLQNDYSLNLQKEKIDRATIDSSIFHLFATFAVTPLMVHYTKKITMKGLSKTNLNCNLKTKILPAFVGLSIIPFVVPPVDNFFNFALNEIYRNKDEKQEIHWRHGIYGFINKKSD